MHFIQKGIISAQEDIVGSGRLPREMRLYANSNYDKQFQISMNKKNSMVME